MAAPATHMRPSCTRSLQLQPPSVQPSGACCPAPASAFWATLQHPSPQSSRLQAWFLCSQRHTATRLSRARSSPLPSAGFTRRGCIAGAWRFAVSLCPQPSLRLYSKPKPQSYPGPSLSRTAPCSPFPSCLLLSCFDAPSGFNLCACRSFNQRCVLPVLVTRRPR